MNTKAHSRFTLWIICIELSTGLSRDLTRYLVYNWTGAAQVASCSE